MTLKFRDVTEENFDEFIALEVKPGQKDNFFFKSTKPNIMSLAQIYIYKDHRILAVYADDIMVGSVFYSPNTNMLGIPNRAWLTRFMIDRRHQGKGYGRQTMLMLFERIRKENGGPVKLGLSYETHNKMAEKLYRSLGFEGSGEKLENQIVVWKRLE